MTEVQKLWLKVIGLAILDLLLFAAIVWVKTW